MRYEVLALGKGPRSGLPVLNAAKARLDTRSSWVELRGFIFYPFVEIVLRLLLLFLYSKEFIIHFCRQYDCSYLLLEDLVP